MTTTASNFLDRFADRETRLLASGPDWLQARRRAARERYDALGLPRTDEEAWRNTNLKNLLGTDFAPADELSPIAEERLAPLATLDLGGLLLSFVDGCFDEPASRMGSVDGLWVGTLEAAIAEHPERIRAYLEQEPDTAGASFESLNGALGAEGAVVLIESNAQIEPIVHLRYLSGSRGEATASHPRTLILAGDGSHATVVETYAGAQDATYFTNAVTQVDVGANTQLHHVRVNAESEAAYHVATLHSRQVRDSNYSQVNLCLGGKLVRNHVTAVLDGEGSNGKLLGLIVGKEQQHIDNHTILDHARAHGDTRELYKTILADQARSVFSGRIIVREGAQKTDAKQSNPNLLLSPDALAQTRPQLEIYADDVKCTHGATVGQMDDDALFYLRSRGIPEADARHMLIGAFAGEVLEAVEPDTLRSTLEQVVRERLPR